MAFIRLKERFGVDDDRLLFHAEGIKVQILPRDPLRFEAAKHPLAVAGEDAVQPCLTGCGQKQPQIDLILPQRMLTINALQDQKGRCR